MSRIILIGLALIAIGGAIGVFMYNKPHAELASQKADFTMTASELFAAFEANESEANATYLDKLVEVSGTVGEKTASADGGTNIILKEEGAFSGVSCAFLAESSAALEKVEVGSSITIKGLCTGMLMDVSLARCVLVE